MGIIFGVVAVVIVAAILKYFLGKSRQDAALIEFRTRLIKVAHNSGDDRATEQQINHCVRLLDEAQMTSQPDLGETLTKQECSDLIMRLQLAVVDRQGDPDELEAEQMQSFASSAAENAEHCFTDAKYCVDDIKEAVEKNGLDGEDTEKLLKEANDNLQQCKKAVAAAEAASNGIYGDDDSPPPTPKQIHSACEQALKASQLAREFELKIQAILRTVNSTDQEN